MTAEWWSQPFAPEGSAAAEGIVKQLGRPTMDPLTVLVREAAQNSADAQRDDASVVDFRIDVRTLGDSAETWRRVLLPGPAAESGVAMDATLQRESVVLVVSDRNTVGLGGPVRADRMESGQRRSDFVQFLRNVGEPSDHEFGGGTYGFGKGVFYRVSRCGTVLVDTRTVESGPLNRRLMGAALGRSWISGEQRFTGRHWWGEIVDGVPDPLVGDEAGAVADLLGLPGFADGRTGTDIVVVGADLGNIGGEYDGARGRTTHEAATFLASSILWNLWPKFVPDASGRHMRFVVAVDGKDLEVPSPEGLPEFAPFVEALNDVREGRGAEYTRVTPPRRGGSFALGLTDAEQESTRLLVGAARPFDGPPRHVARMRSVELVVDYVEGPAHPNSHLAYGGVFKASHEADRAFAAAEPPTHDDWVPSGLRGSDRGVVQGARTFLNRQLDERLGFGSLSGGAGQGLGQLAARLASVIPARLPATVAADDEAFVPDIGGGGSAGAGGAGTGGGVGGGSAVTVPPVGGSGGAVAGRRGGRARLMGPPRLTVFEGVPFVVAHVFVPESDSSRTVTAEAFVVVEGGARETEAPQGADVPRVVQWQPADASEVQVVPGATVVLPPGPGCEWWVYASHVPDGVVRFRLSQEVHRAH